MGGETGLWQALKDVGADPNLTTWGQRSGGGLEVGTEALTKLLAKVFGGGAAGVEYLTRTGGDILKGGAQTGVLGETLEGAGKGLESLVASGPTMAEQLTKKFDQQISVLNAKLNELQNAAINLDIDPGGEQRAAAMATLVEQRDQLAAQYELAMANLPEVDAPTIPQSIANWFGINVTDERVDALARRLGMGDGEQPLPPGEITPTAPTGAGMLDNYDLYLEEMNKQGAAGLEGKQAAFLAFLKDQGVGGRGDRKEVVEEVDPVVEEEGASWMDKLLDIGTLLGGGAGSSEGYEFMNINQAAAQRRAVEQAQEFDLAKQAEVLKQRTAEYENRAAQARALARAEAVLEQRPYLLAEIKNDPKRKEYERELMDDPAINRGWLLPRDQDTIDVKLAEWDAEQLKIRMRALGEYFNETTQLFEPPLAATTTAPTVTEGFGEVRSALTQT